MAWLLVGSIPGVLIGSQVGVRLPDRPLRFALATVLVLSGIKVVDVPESSWIIVGSLIACAVYLVYWARNARVEARAVAAGTGD